ncbi:CoA-transferase [Sporolactobacillus spathodeae]|uniref:3-oxoacid CoA-transferase n=1 Tax=Sporolactobacillus spathodeae TaxID=1465502 RepID=A0ABS2QBX2_9BACL|nr:CoA-transferase [Sporolactobacillus spathodeae]MBM7658920.1 3-oxoacid CoA-transferase [Sporolactobacillus spathodeae]
MNTLKEVIARRAAAELEAGSIVNLGIGIPTLITQYVPPDSIFFHTENGLLGVGALEPNDYDPLRVNAGKLPVGELKGASYFDSAASFGMIRGGHISVAVLGALQVDAQGLVANWAVPNQNIIGVGGAMDLLVGAKKVIITMLHTTKNNQPKLIASCTCPVTSIRPADLVITERAVFRRLENTWYLTEILEGNSLDTIRRDTAFAFDILLNFRERKERPL